MVQIVKEVNHKFKVKYMSDWVFCHTLECHFLKAFPFLTFGKESIYNTSLKYQTGIVQQQLNTEKVKICSNCSNLEDLNLKNG